MYIIIGIYECIYVHENRYNIYICLCVLSVNIHKFAVYVCIEECTKF